MLSTFCRPAANAALSAARRFGRNRWLAIVVEKLWVKSGAPFGIYTNLLISHDASDRVVVALRNLLFGSAALASASALRFTILSTVGLTSAGYPSEMKADAYSVACVQNQRPRP
jgi:hypothetical protein